MKYQEALDASNYLHGKPIVRKCCECGECIDEASKTIIDTRKMLEYLQAIGDTRKSVSYEVSHTYCEDCQHIILEQLK